MSDETSVVDIHLSAFGEEHALLRVNDDDHRYLLTREQLRALAIKSAEILSRLYGTRGRPYRA